MNFSTFVLFTSATVFLFTPVLLGLRATNLVSLVPLALIYAAAYTIQKRDRLPGRSNSELAKIIAINLAVQSVVVLILYFVGLGAAQVFKIERVATPNSPVLGTFEIACLAVLILSSACAELVKSRGTQRPDLDLGPTQEREPEPEKIFSVPSEDHFIVGELKQLPSESSIIEFKDGKLNLEILGTPISKEALALAQDARRVVSDRDEGGVIGFRFQEFVFSSFEPRLQTQHPGNQSYIWETGFQFGVRFFGDIEILPGLFQMRGELRHDYEPSGSGVPCSVRMKLPNGSVHPRHFMFTSLKDAETAGPDCVYALNVVTTDIRDLKRISLFKNLNEAILNIDPPTNSSGVTSDDEIESLRSISKLENLTRLWLKSDRHLEMPIEIFSLRNLVDLTFSAQITHLPPAIVQLTQLQSLGLQENRLTSLPQQIGELPHLRNLDLRRNPFQALPSTLSKISRVRIEHEKRALYMDLSYPHNKNIEIDQKIFKVTASEPAMSTLNEKLKAHDLSERQQEISENARLAIDLRTPRAPKQDANKSTFELKVGSTKIGGTPDLKHAEDWPTVKDSDGNTRRMRFLAQLNFAELSDLQNYLPRQGLLSIFIDQWNDFPFELRTLYSTDTKHLSNQKLPASEMLSDGDGADAYPGAPISPVLLVSIPDSSHNDEIDEAYDALKRDLDGESEAEHVRLGPHTINAYVFTQGRPPERDAAEKKLGQENEWMSLISIGYDQNVGFQFDDCGSLTLCIHKADLAALDFSRLHSFFYSS